MGENYLPSVKILGAMFLAVMLVVGAYVLARGGGSASIVSASSEAELLQKIASLDTDSDGLRDWEEVLYGTNPKVSDTRELGMTDGEAVARGLIVPIAPSDVQLAATTPSEFDPSIPVPAEGTITRVLSESFFTNYMEALRRSPDGNLSSAEIQKLSETIIEELNEALYPAPDFRTQNTIKIAGSGPEAMRQYAAAAEAIFRSNKTTASKVDIVYLQMVLEDEDESVYPHLLSISKMYKDTATGLAALSVPKEVADDHLLLINAMARLSKVTADFTRAESDPFATLLALKIYPTAMKNMGTAFINIHRKYRTAGVTFLLEEPGAAFVGVVERVAAEQAARGDKQP